MRDLAPADAVADLLASPAQARRLVIEYAAELRWRGRAHATIQRRLATLRSLTHLANQLGMVRWLLELPDDEEVAAAARRSSKDAYVLPRHPSEIDRLDIQHYAVREALGAHYLAPVRSPKAVLDVGCGTGRWAFEMCDEFPDATVVGHDLVKHQTSGAPAGYEFVKGNAVEGLPFTEDSFDLVHQRFLIAGIPVQSWPLVVSELARVTTPGGWVEVAESPPWLKAPGPATRNLGDLYQRLLYSRGLDSASQVFSTLDDHLRETGLTDVTGQTFELPMGQWGGQVGSLLATDARAAFTRVAAVFERELGVPGEETDKLIRAMQDEFEEYRTRGLVHVAFGRKPDRS